MKVTLKIALFPQHDHNHNQIGAIKESETDHFHLLLE